MMNPKLRDMRKCKTSFLIALSVLIVLIIPVAYAGAVSVPTTSMSFQATSGSSWSFEGSYSAGWTSGTQSKTYWGLAYLPDINIYDEDYLKLRVDHWDEYDNCPYKIEWRYAWPNAGPTIYSPWESSSTMDAWIIDEIPLLWGIAKPSYAEVQIVFHYTPSGGNPSSNGFELVRYELV